MSEWRTVKEHTAKAADAINLAADDLQSAYAGTGPMAAIVFAGLLKDAVSLRDRISQVMQAMEAGE